MFWVALALGVLAVGGLHFLFSRLGALPEPRRRTIRKWLLIGALVVAALLLLRLGMPYIASLFGGLAVFGTLFHRFMALLPLLRWVYQRRRSQQRQGNAGSQSQPNRSGRMSRKEAAEVLGVAETASKKEVNAAYKRLMQKMHPDLGGSEYMARQLNEARDVLLGK